MFRDSSATSPLIPTDMTGMKIICGFRRFSSDCALTNDQTRI
jgi:hypothetical protein